MGMYCCCGVKKRQDWVCSCDWDGWFLCYERDNLPVKVPIKKIPDKDEIYEVRIFEDGDDRETTSKFSLVKKNWGQYTNQAISNWEVEYDDKWSGFIGVFAWKEKI
jgi:hypothetical protein